MPRVIVDVMLKPEILDPQGRAVAGALGRLGLVGVTEVRQGKQFVIDLADEPGHNTESDGPLSGSTLAHLHELAGSLLSNPVIETYQLRVEAGRPQ